jgi:predicted GTPase
MSSDLNIAILGKEGVGKSWLANRLVCGLSKDKNDY